jgi:hypothetical protein
MLAHTEGPPSEHLTLADLDAATLTLVIPAAGGGEASLWLGEPLPPFVVANALRAVAEEVAPLSAPEGSAYPRGMGEDHRSAETGRYVTDAEAEAHPDTTVTEHDQVHPLVRASTQDLIDELASRARLATAAGETWPDDNGGYR